MFHITFGFLIASLILLWIYFKIKMHHMVELAKKIPGPKPLPIVGNALQLATNTKEVFKQVIELEKEYGSLFCFWVGSILSVQIANPEDIETVLSTSKLLDKAWSYKYVEPWLGTGILTGTGQKWKAHRKLINPTFHVKLLEENVSVFNANSNTFTKLIAKHIDGLEFNIYPYITMCALDNICDTAMGISINAQENSNSEYVQATKSICDIIMLRSFRPWLHPDLLFNLSSLGKKHKQCLEVLHGMTNNVIASRKKELLQANTLSTNNHIDDIGKKKRFAFLDLLILSSKDGVSLTDEEIREEVDTIMFAGHDTTATAMGFTCWTLATNQHAQNRVMLELKEIFGDSNREPTFQDTQEMKYLEMAIKETLRLYPSVPLYGRHLTEDLPIDGYVLPAGTNAFITPYSTHRNPKYYPDPEKFDPERFLPENIQARHPYSYVPFAGGPRNCVGQKYGLLEIKVTICQLLRSYKLLPGNTPIDITNEIVLKSASGINIKLEQR